MEIADFLLARIAEDEAVARADGADRWHAARFLYDARPQGLDWDKLPEAEQEEWAEAADRLFGSLPDWIDPDRVLAKCAADRLIVNEHSQDGGYGDEAGVCTTCNRVAFPCPTLRLLALPYADHEDYQPEWGAAVTSSR